MLISRFKKWGFYAVALLILSISTLLSFSSFKITINKLKETEKCPLCFGLTACHLIDDNKLAISNKNIYTLFSNYFGVKNVYYGKMGDTEVVLKRLAHNAELKCFDDKISQQVKQKFSNVDFQTFVEEALSSNMTDTTSKLRLCPTIRNRNLLFQNIISHKSFEYGHLWTLIEINPEPLILQILPAENGWPVPKYYGACGRFVIEEFVGPLLTSYYQKPWNYRAKIAFSLLDAANMFTFQDENFAYYLTDVSSDNIAVDSNNRVKFIDLENIIVVDKFNPTEDQTMTWQKVHRSDSDFNCEDCLVFSPADICKHKVSDHNYYAICKHILARKFRENQISDGFLHGVPADVLQQYPALIDVITRCSEPDLFNHRINAGFELSQLLKYIIKNIKY